MKMQFYSETQFSRWLTKAYFNGRGVRWVTPMKAGPWVTINGYAEHVKRPASKDEPSEIRFTAAYNGMQQTFTFWAALVGLTLLRVKHLNLRGASQTIINGLVATEGHHIDMSTIKKYEYKLLDLRNHTFRLHGTQDLWALGWDLDGTTYKVVARRNTYDNSSWEVYEPMTPKTELEVYSWLAGDRMHRGNRW